jgi:glutaredoxin
MYCQAILVALLAAVAFGENRRYMDYMNTMNKFTEEIRLQIKQNSVYMICSTYCMKSKDAEDLLDELAIPYKLVNWDEREQPWFFLEAARTFGDGRQTMPLIFVCGRYIGDYDDLVRLSEAGSLKVDAANCN